jgi:hypothetical protein
MLINMAKNVVTILCGLGDEIKNPRFLDGQKPGVFGLTLDANKLLEGSDNFD